MINHVDSLIWDPTTLNIGPQCAPILGPVSYGADYGPHYGPITGPASGERRRKKKLPTAGSTEYV